MRGLVRHSNGPKEKILKDEITVMVEETETRHHAIFSVKGQLTNKAKHTVWECVANAHCS